MAKVKQRFRDKQWEPENEKEEYRIHNEFALLIECVIL